MRTGSDGDAPRPDDEALPARSEDNFDEHLGQATPSDPDSDAEIEDGFDQDAFGTDGFDDDSPDDGEHSALPSKVEAWRKRSATGAILTGFALGLQQALERRDQRPAFVIEAPGEPEDEDAPIRLHFDPDDPSNTVAIVRSDDAGHNSAARPVDGPEEDQPDR